MDRSNIIIAILIAANLLVFGFLGFSAFRENTKPPEEETYELDSFDVLEERAKAESSNDSRDYSERAYQEYPAQYRKVMGAAESYSDNCLSLSKERIHWLLEHPEGFSKEEADYAISHLNSDWRRNALHYYKNMEEWNEKTQGLLSDEEIYDFTVDRYMGRFSKEEGRYAMQYADIAASTMIDNSDEKKNATNKSWWEEFDSDNPTAIKSHADFWKYCLVRLFRV